MLQPIKGTTEECLTHFSKTCGEFINRNRQFVRTKICRLLNIGNVSGHNWFDKCVMPTGINLLKLQLFLELVGYTLVERKQLNDIQRRLANQLALLVLSTKETAAQTGVTNDTVLRWVSGRVKPVGGREKALKALLEIHRDETQKKMKDCERNLKAILFSETQEPAKPEPNPIVASSKTADAQHGQIIEILAHIILAARPLAEKVLSDDFSPEDRNRLRELTLNGRSNGVFDLSNLLNRLCGERARNEL